MTPHVQDNQPRDVEIAIFQYAVAIVFLWLLTGFWELQVRDPELYEERAARNSVKSLPVLAPRGKILDRDGRILVDNLPSFHAVLSIADLNPDNYALIAEGLSLADGEIEARVREAQENEGPQYRNITIKEHLSEAEIAFLEAHRPELREVELALSQRRLYPRGGVGAHVLGYVGEISEEELNQPDFVLYKSGTEIGKSGIERQYEGALRGADGSRLVVVDSRSRWIRDLDLVEPIGGENLRLTIDADLQAVAELALEGRRGAVVALDPNNGELLVVTSSPAFDLNQLISGISRDDWGKVLSDPDKPLLNRATQAQRAPGSIFKPIVALAAVATGAVDPDFKVLCKGGATFYDRYFRCHTAAGHGWVDLESAMVHSCDVYFYTIGHEVGIDTIAEYAKLAGFGDVTRVDLPAEERGLLPSSSWKIRYYRDKWYAGETISVAIGQGPLTVTPLQAAYALGGLVAGGVWHRPHLLSYDQRKRMDPDFEPPEPNRLDIEPKHLDALIRGLRGVINEGTGARAALPGYDVCGKTGTAQRVSRRFAETNTNPRYFDDAWFVGFAPCVEPEIIVTALFENGEHGPLAAPIVRDVIKAHFDKKRRLDWDRATQPPKRPPSSDPSNLSAAASGARP